MPSDMKVQTVPTSDGRRSYLGLDVGLTSVKVAAFDDRGSELHVESAPMPRSHVDASTQDIDMGELWRVAAGVLRSMVDYLDAEGFAISGVAVTGHGNGLYPVGEDLTPTRAAIPSTDSRARSIVEAVPEQDRQKMRDITGSIPWAAQPATLMRWLADHEPQTYRATTWILSCKDWITLCLTGQPSADYSDASACGLVSLEDRTYHSAAFETVGLPASDLERLPPLHGSGEVVGALTSKAAAATGIDEGTPVIAGCMDCVAATVGAGGDDLGDVTVIVGTWAINGVVCRAQIPAPHVTLSALMPSTDRMLAMEVAPTSAANLEWLRKAIADPNRSVEIESLMKGADAVPAGSDGLLFFPFIHGSTDVPAGSGTFLGLAGMHTRGHLVRSVLEGVAHFHRLQLEAIVASGADIADRPWRLAGGGAHSALWAQIFADILGRPVQRRLVSQLGARGVASMLPTALGLRQTPWSETTEALTVEPGRDSPQYRDQADLFDRLIESLRPVWGDLSGAR